MGLFRSPKGQPDACFLGLTLDREMFLPFVPYKHTRRNHAAGCSSFKISEFGWNILSWSVLLCWNNQDMQLRWKTKQRNGQCAVVNSKDFERAWFHLQIINVCIAILWHRRFSYWAAVFHIPDNTSKIIIIIARVIALNICHLRIQSNEVTLRRNGLLKFEFLWANIFQSVNTWLRTWFQRKQFPDGRNLICLRVWRISVIQTTSDRGRYFFVKQTKEIFHKTRGSSEKPG